MNDKAGGNGLCSPIFIIDDVFILLEQKEVVHVQANLGRLFMDDVFVYCC